MRSFTLSSAIFLVASYRKTIYSDSLVLKIDYDVEKDAFVILRAPQNLFDLGEPDQLLVKCSDFRQLPNSMQTDDCLYYDAKSNTKFATVNRG